MSMWQKASFSSHNGACVEVRPAGDGVDVRDSKNPDGPIQHYSTAEFAQFVQWIKTGNADPLL